GDGTRPHRAGETNGRQTPRRTRPARREAHARPRRAVPTRDRWSLLPTPGWRAGRQRLTAREALFCYAARSAGSGGVDVGCRRRSAGASDGRRTSPAAATAPSAARTATVMNTAV